jgi:phosphoglycolate phosphatase
VITRDGSRLLVLWDIDHTLIETRGLGGELYRRAFETATGQRMLRQADVTGQTEPAILTATLRLHNIEQDEPYLERYIRALGTEYEQQQDELRRRGQVLPGARQALAALAEWPGVIQTVLSGNLRAVSVIKLRVFELDQYLDLKVGAYGDDDTDRPKLVGVAQQRAQQKYGSRFTRDNTTVIGDSRHDVATAVKGGALAVAVASGKDSEDTLWDAGADVVWPDLTNLQQILDTVDP